MGRNVRFLMVGCALLSVWHAPLWLAHAADPQQTNAELHWSVTDIAQHIDALDRVSPPQAGAQELVRILSAIMSQPDATIRLVLFNRLRPHIVPYQAPARDAALRATPSADQPSP